MNYLKQSINAFSTFVLAICAAGNVWALETSQHNQFQSLDDIHQLVENHVKQKVDQQLFDIHIQMRKLSPELNLPSCASALQLIDNRLDRVAGRMTIRVICAKPKWQVFVPVNVDGKKPLIISAKAILNRAVITHEDVKQVYVSYKKIPSGSLVDLNKAIGMRAKRAIGANQPLKIRDLQPPFWVYKNKEVTIITRTAGIEVKTKGTALKSGVNDEQVPVANSKTKKIIYGIVIAPNTVLIP